jgi:hypothetical protein
METAKSKIFVGVSGFGKSWIMGYDIEEWFSKGFFPIVIDKKRDHTSLGKHLNFKAVKVGDKSIENVGANKWKKLIKQTKKKGYGGIMIQPDKANPEIDQDDLIKLCNTISYAVLSLNFPVYFGVEEIRNYAPAQSNDKDFNALKTVIVEGRSEDVVFGGTCQFPQQVHHKVFNSAPILYVFGLGIDDKKYSKVSISGSTREKMKNWHKQDRKYLKINQNSGTQEIKSSKNISRSTPHSG